jgi:hypothetical protein
LRITPTTPNSARFGPTTPTRAMRLSDASVDPTDARVRNAKAQQRRPRCGP